MLQTLPATLGVLAEGFLEDAAVEFVEVVGLDAVVAGCAVVGVEVLVTQAQSRLNYFECLEALFLKAELGQMGYSHLLTLLYSKSKKTNQ